uniref:PNPLA domain-containing protein n=1 Tax=Aureoumbra lagunensis TaxID=44058 RepID=A0A7S3K2A7_9STRA|mmetsp:Transcript_4930/g.6968  ORF Transcript_4930/g.6968 Transcript_4930/m.6968 type:complete len:313 (+) Transcript_4930:80-1018(+)
MKLRYFKSFVFFVVLPCSRSIQYAQRIADRSLLLPGGGLFFWWQMGALERINEVKSEKDLRIAGASAGALAAVCAKSNVKCDEARKLAIELSDAAGIWERGRFGLSGIWGQMIRKWLEELLPSNAAELNRETRLFLLARRRFGYQRILATDFLSKNDVIDAALASAHVPFFLDGKAEAKWRQYSCLDGSIFLSRSRHIANSCQGFATIHHSLELGLEYDTFTHNGVAIEKKPFFNSRQERKRLQYLRQKDESAFALPSHVIDAHSADTWLKQLSARGYKWANDQLSFTSSSDRTEEQHLTPIARALLSPPDN